MSKPETTALDLVKEIRRADYRNDFYLSEGQAIQTLQDALDAKFREGMRTERHMHG